MFKKFLSGIVFGAGFAIAFIVGMVIFFFFFFQPLTETNFTSPKEVVTSAPDITEIKRYLGSSGTYVAGFRDQKPGLLSEGPGEIIGKATSNDKPVSGLKLRLALNGSVLSQWATTGADGSYSVRVPHGKYRIDGFEIDTDSANAVLAGKIDDPQTGHVSDVLDVAKGAKGQGLTFRFIDPVQKKLSKKKFTATEPIIIDWFPYPGASNYSIQIYEKSDAHALFGNNTIFSWSNQPRVSGTSFDLSKHGVTLKAGKFYSVEIHAHDAKMNYISHTHRAHHGYDFEVTE